MDDSKQNAAEELEAIAFVGETLAPFFLEDPRNGGAGALYDVFAVVDVAAAAAEWPFGNEADVRAGLSLMVAGLTDGVTDDLTWEYRRLFVGPGKKPAPPWGSVYTDYEGVIFGATTLDLRAWMRTNGIERRAGEGDPDDHIGLLLLLMAWIARNRSDLLDDFLRLHVLTWSSHYLNELRDATGHLFFQGLAGLADVTLEGIRTDRGIAVDYPRFYR